jgi:hypothetical protein
MLDKEIADDLSRTSTLLILLAASFRCGAIHADRRHCGSSEDSTQTERRRAPR